MSPVRPRRWAAAAALAALLLAQAAQAAYDDEPGGLVGTAATLAKVRALYERAHQRDYTRAATVIEDWRLFQDGTVGEYRVYQLGKDVRAITTLGPVSYQKGVLHGIHWQQDRNGITFVDAGLHDQRLAASERAFRDPGDDRDVRLVGESPATGAYVVEVDPPAGIHEWLFIDKRTGLLTRSEAVERHARITTTYDDYRLFDGVWDPSRIFTTDTLGNEREQLLVNRGLDTTPDPRDVEMPPSRRVVEFTGKPGGTVRLPVRFVDGLPVIRVIVGRSAYDFLLDSGAAGIFIDPTVADQQKLERFGTHIGSTMGAFQESMTVIPLLTVGDLRMRNLAARVVAIPFQPDSHTRIVGLLGFDFFADVVVHLDLEHNLAEAIAPERFHPPSDAASATLSLDDRTPAIHISAGSALGRVVLDTGANQTVFENGFADRGEFAPDRFSGTTRVRGIGGSAFAVPTRLPGLEIAGLWLRDVTADVSNADLGSDEVDGTLGTDLLRSYELWFDYRANAVYLRRARR
ncbi:MAG TPA: aspartyl protease family protein [Candidatus Sulfotelmatobacter sp.]|nr:aspartyl protease family protein [Candidatus Sulfotelmatobacter sp.]